MVELGRRGQLGRVDTVKKKTMYRIVRTLLVWVYGQGFDILEEGLGLKEEERRKGGRPE